jgi:hypothetical protein
LCKSFISYPSGIILADKKLIGRETCQKVRLIKITMVVAINTTPINLIAAGLALC